MKTLCGLVLAIGLCTTASATPNYKTDMRSNKAYGEALLTLHYFMIGHDGPVITAFFDPNCIWCHTLYKQAAPFLRAGKIRIRVIMVGTLKRSSTPKAETILASRDPARALAYDEAHYKQTSEEGGIVPAKHIPPAVRTEVSENTQFLSQTTGALTPTMIVLKHGRLFVYEGFPADKGIQGILNEWNGP